MSEPINFFKGHLSPHLFPNTEMADAFSRVLVDKQFLHYAGQTENQYPLEYGPDPGNYEIRETIIKWSNMKYGHKSYNAACVNLTAGASYGAANILLACTRPDITKRVFLVSPTYFLINYAFVDAGFEGKMSAVVETPGEKYDIDLAGFEASLKEIDEAHGLQSGFTTEENIFEDPMGRGPRKYYRYVMYLVPTFSNPGGLKYSEETRCELLEIARRHDVLLISDDVYDFLDYDGSARPAKLNHIDQDSLPDGWVYGNTISNSSFSKLIAPGLRTGWQETATPSLAQQLATTGANKSGGTPSHLNTFVVQDMIETGALDRCILKLVTALKSRAEALIAALYKYIPAKYLQVVGGSGGYFVWCTITEKSVDVRRTLELVKQECNVIIAEGYHFEVAGASKGWDSSARLCVGYLSEEQIERGIREWGRIMRREHPNVYEL